MSLDSLEDLTESGRNAHLLHFALLHPLYPTLIVAQPIKRGISFNLQVSVFDPHGMPYVAEDMLEGYIVKLTSFRDGFVFWKPEILQKLVEGAFASNWCNNW